MPNPRFALAEALRRRVVGDVRALFNDQAKGEQPTPMSDSALFARGSVIWRVHGDVTTMMVGGISALLMQMLHPLALAGVWDHSRFRDDMIGRLRRTARFIAVTTYGDRAEAEKLIGQVRRAHDSVKGARPDGTIYAASDPHLLAWVHVCEAISFLDGWIRYGEPGMSRADQDRYFAESAVVARMLGAGPVPETRAEADAILRSMRHELLVDARTREVCKIILSQRPDDARGAMAQSVITDASVALLPQWARAMHGFRPSPLKAPLVHLGTFGMAQTLRWAFAGEYRQPQN
jgi:uncharacterized protein (DUF2236 family)